MKDISSTLKKCAAGLGLLFLSFTQSEYVEKDSIFYAKEHEDKLRIVVPYDLDSNGIYDGVIAIYDFNNNGKADVSAYFKLIRVENGVPFTEGYARYVLIDNDEDGKAEYGLMDKDNNMTLETKVFRVSWDKKSVFV